MTKTLLVRARTSSRSRGRLALAAALPAAVLSVFARPAAADDTVATWTTATGGNWTTAADWSSNPYYPNNNTPGGSTYAAVIGATGSAYTVTLNGAIAVDTLTLSSASATLDQTAGNLSAAAVNLVAGTYKLGGGTLLGATVNLSGGAMNVSSGTLDGVTVNGGPVSVNASGSLHVNAGTTATGGITLGNNASLYLDGPGRSLLAAGPISGPATGAYFIYLEPAAAPQGGGQTYTLESASTLAGSFVVEDAGQQETLLNQGTLDGNQVSHGAAVAPEYFDNQALAEATGGGMLTIQAELSSSNEAAATITATAGSMVQVSSYAWTNAGTISAIGAGANAILSSSTMWSNSGTIVASGAGATASLSGSWSNSGNLVATSGGTLSLGGTFATASLVGLNGAGGAVNLTGTLNNSGATLALTATTGPINVSGGTINGGTVAQSVGVTLKVAKGTLDNLSVTGADLSVSASGSLYSQNLSIGTGRLNLGNLSTWYVDGPTQTLSNLTVTSTGSLAYVRLHGIQLSEFNDGPQTYTFGPTVTLAGPITVSDYDFQNTLVNQGTINANAAGVLSIQNAAFSNQGLAEATGGGTLTIQPTQPWNNSGGTVKAGGTGSVANLYGNWTSTGTLSVASGGTLNLGTGTNSWSNAGTITGAAGGTINLGGSITPSAFGTITPNGAAVNVTGALNNSGGTLVLSATTGSLTVAGGGNISGGTVVVSAGATLTANNGSLYGVTVTGGPVVATAAGLEVDGGTSVAGGITVLPTSGLSLDGPGRNIDAAGPLALPTTGYYTIDLNGNPSLTGSGQTYTVESGLTLTGAFQINDYSYQNTLVNQGTLNASSPGNTAAVMPAYFVNHGLAEVTAGTLIINTGQSFNNSGGTVLAGSGGAADLFAATTNGGGTITAASGGTVTLYNTLTGGTVNVSGGTLVEKSGAALAGTLVLQASGSGGLAVVGSSNTYVGGTTIAGGATVQANATKSSLGSGPTVVNAGGVLAGTGATGGPVVVNSGGTVTAGSGATTADTTGSLTTGTQTWNAGGQYLAKVNAGTVSNGSNGGTATADQLVMSGLTITSSPSGPFAVSVVGLGGSPTTFAVGSQLVLATIPGGSANTFQNNLGSLVLTTSNLAFPTADAGGLAELDAGGSVELVLDVVPAPEPRGVLLAAVAVVPLALGRRRRRGTTVV